MDITWISGASLLLLGAFSGFLSGLLGIGGGVVLVPSLLWIFQWQGMVPEMVPFVVTSTSFSVMVFTGLSASYSHYGYGNVSFRLVGEMMLGLVMGAIMGRFWVNQLPVWGFNSLLGLGVMLIALHLLFSSITQNTEEVTIKKTTPVWCKTVLVGCAIGNVATLFGIGGGIVMISYFLQLGIPLAITVGTSAVCGWGFSCVASIWAALYPASVVVEHSTLIGAIYWPCVLLTGGVGTAFARFGAWSSRFIPLNWVRWSLVVFMLLSGVWMLDMVRVFVLMASW